VSTATGTATDYGDLLNKLRTFLTTDTTLVGLGQNWTELGTNAVSYTWAGNLNTNTTDFETYLKAPGLSGSDPVYINIRLYKNVTADYYNWECRGALGYNASFGFAAQPGTSPGEWVPMWNQPIQYWFVANGQRAIVITKISSSYEILYAGKFLPYGTPGQYPYPVAIGGMLNTSDLRFSDNSANHAAFFNPINLQACYVDSSWQTFNNSGSTRNIWPHGAANGSPAWLQPGLDGTYPLLPCRLEMGTASATAQAAAPAAILGEFDGVAIPSGVSNSSESTITVGASTYTVFQNAFRTAADAYCAIQTA